MIKKVMASVCLSLMLMGTMSGCSNGDEEADTSAPEVGTGRAFEESSNESNEEDNDRIIGQTTSTDEEGITKLKKERMKSYLEAAAFSMDENKDKSGYMDEMYYATNPYDPEMLELDLDLSSSESYCIRGTSREFSEFVMYYDSQIKSVVPEGKSCKPVKGTPWSA